MKKYNGMIFISFTFYLLIAFFVQYKLQTAAVNKEKMYKVEINRIYHSLSGESSLDKLDLRPYQYVKEVSFLKAKSLSKEKETLKFYEEENKSQKELKPFYKNGRLEGIFCFTYVMPDLDIHSAALLFQIGLALMEVLVLSVFIYLKYKLLRPFQKISVLPLDLANGHFKETIKEEKNKYFTNFLRGIGALQDTLDVTRKRELTLVKEKKKLLLSLSHEIKNPLNTIKLYGKALEEGIYEDREKERHAARQIGVKAEEIRCYAEEIMKNAREDILDISVVNDEFYLSDLIQKVMNTYCEKCTISMVEFSVSKYENRLLKGDIERSFEVFENILENALKYGDGNRIHIDFSEEEYCLLIKIFNTGKQVSDNEITHIFESFFRGSNSERMQGNGLGLYICKEIMRKMDGDIFTRKEEGGMAFIVVFRC